MAAATGAVVTGAGGGSGVRGNDSAVRGDTSAVRGNDSAVRGDTSAVRGDDSAVRGDMSAVRDDNSAVGADGSPRTGNDSFAAGCMTGSAGDLSRSGCKTMGDGVSGIGPIMRAVETGLRSSRRGPAVAFGASISRCTDSASVSDDGNGTGGAVWAVAAGIVSAFGPTETCAICSAGDGEN